MTGVLVKGDIWTQAHPQGESDVNMKAKLRLMYLQAPRGPEIARSEERGMKQILPHSPHRQGTLLLPAL